MVETVDESFSSSLPLNKIDVPKLKKTLLEELSKDPSRCSQIANKLNAPVYSLIDIIETVIAKAIPKAKLSPKSVLGFDKECKEKQIKVKRLKKIWKREWTIESWEKFWLARAEKERVIDSKDKNESLSICSYHICRHREKTNG